MVDPIPTLCGVPFRPLQHRDGRFIYTAGLFAFARREGSYVYTVLHLELTEAINRTAVPGHPRWGWALREGMDTLLIHKAGEAASLDNGVEVVWHSEARVALGEPDDGDLDIDHTAQVIRPAFRQSGI